MLHNVLWRAAGKILHCLLSSCKFNELINLGPDLTTYSLVFLGEPHFNAHRHTYVDGPPSLYQPDLPMMPLAVLTAYHMQQMSAIRKKSFTAFHRILNPFVSAKSQLQQKLGLFSEESYL